MKTRHFSALFLAMVMVIATCMIPASAAEVTTDEHGIQPRYEISCPGGGKHDMRLKGNCCVYSGPYSNPGKLLFNGTAFKCSKCGLVCGSQYNMLIMGFLGGYCMESSPIQEGSLYFFYNGVDDFYWGDLQHDSFMQGFEWHT